MESQKKQVLVIDDQEEICDLIDVTFRGSEFEFHSAKNGREGIQIAKDSKPELILLDVMMPGFDGFTTIKVLKRNPDTKDIPVIFLTAKKSKSDIQAAIRAGGVDYIAKPFSPSDLLTRLRRILEIHEVKQTKKTNKTKTNDVGEELKKKGPSVQYPQKPLIKVTRYKEVVVFSTALDGIALENCPIYRDAFASIVSDGIFKVVFDMGKIRKIDGAGLALLISVNEALKKYGGELRITFPPKEVNNRFSFK